MSPRRLRFAFSILQVATFATLLRSVALDRWITVAASILLLVAAYVAQRGRTWGVALSFALGIMFTGVWALGIAPPWFALVGFLAARPFARLFSHFYRFDRGAAMMLAVLGVGVGSAGAFAWKQFAFDLFSTFPSLIPSAYPHHGLAILGIVAAFAVGRRFVPPLPAIAAETTAASEETVTTRIAEPTTHVRVAGAEGAALTERAEEEAALAELDSELQGRAARR